MNLAENIRMAWEGLRSNKMRAFLTMLGIIIGIASVIGILTVGDGMRTSLKDSMSSLGASNITVYLSPRDSGNTADPEKADRLTEDMLNLLAEAYPKEIKGISISESVGSGKITIGHKDSNVSVTGVNGDYMALNDVNIQRGRGILQRDIDGARNVAVVSDTLVDDLFGGSAKLALGSDISVPIGTDTDKFTIVGIYEYEQEDNLRPQFSASGSSTDIYIPLSTAKQLSGSDDGYTVVSLSTASSLDSAAFATQTEKFFDKYYGKNKNWTVEARSMDSIIETMDSMMGTVSLALSIIAGISLLVGGIGVMNIMLVSVTERTREIGTRKAIGATNANIRIQFVVESVIVCLIGGIIGIIVGGVLGYFGSSMMGFAALPTISSILLAFGFSIGIGIFFGYYPANKAAKLDPIEALRYE